ncbi:MAG: hypothetical protein HZA89_13215 [Verrucomicrobia bacterium]|nr:hypothetical protein [Verrucomicrobiota bacterium]
MTNTEAVEAIKKTCGAISAEMLKLMPAVNGVADKTMKDELLKAVFELTRAVETVKKLARKAETNEATPLT